jgi:hypothetical protein
MLLALALASVQCAALFCPSGIHGGKARGDPAGWRGQSPRTTKGTISGQVVAPDGRPVPYASVYAAVVGGSGGGRNVVADASGGFEIAGLRDVAYTLTAYTDGYVLDPDPPQPTYYRIGDTVRLKMIKGGVITGKVTLPSGEPVISVAVRVTRVREGDPSAGRLAFPGGRMTDDRGIYRLYGLPAGIYVVHAGGGSRVFRAGQAAPYDYDSPTYYPSGTRDTAKSVEVHSGEEVTGIDIQYRGERGSPVSGTVSGMPAASGNTAAIAYLVDAGRGSIQNIAYANQSTSFAMFGVPEACERKKDFRISPSGRKGLQS